MENKANSLGKLAAAMGMGLLLAAAPVGLRAFGQAPAGRDGVANRLASPGMSYALSAGQPGQPAPTVTVPGSGTRTFPETGKAVRGLFLQYWDGHGGLAQQGFPISEVMGEVSDLNGKPYTVQYFERAVFEYHPGNAPPYDVLLSQLGTFQYGKKYPTGAPNQQANTTAGSQLFRETGHRVGGKFLEYWKSHGGLAQQGYPISEEFTEVSDLNGKPYTVQYFERAVFEYHPGNAPPYYVLLSQLGTFQYRVKYAAGQNPPFEGLVDAGGHKLWISCKGQGGPTVVMEAGLGENSGAWSRVQPQVTGLTRSCVYDRAGLGKSEPGPAPRTSEQIVKELHAALANAKIAGPYVLVGHSQGGLHAQLFAALYKSDTAGLVLVDATHPDVDARFEAVLTPEQVKQRQELIGRNRENVTYEDTHVSGAQVRAAGPLPDVPLVVLRHGRDLQHPAGWPVAEVERVWRELQEDLARSTPRGRLVVAQNSGHFIQVDQPELVIDAVRSVVEKARGK